MDALKNTAGMLAQSALTVVGRLCSKRAIHWLNATTNYLEIGRWFRERKLKPLYVDRHKFELFRLAAERIGGARLLYLEFGVWKGWSTQRWVNYHKNPESRFHGFDSFEGLPGRWNAMTDRGAYNAHGVIPTINDPRVRFFKGWFEDTLPSYEPPDHDVLFANFDADLYESTKVALEAIAPIVRPGTYLYFDEFSDRHNELRAFTEFVEKYGVRFSAFGTTPHLTRVIFQVESIDAELVAKRRRGSRREASIPNVGDTGAR